MSLFACIAIVFVSFSQKKGRSVDDVRGHGAKRSKNLIGGEVGKEIKCLLLSADLLTNMYTIYQ